MTVEEMPLYPSGAEDKETVFSLTPSWDNLIFCQYTGLLDREGKPIYEGDVIALYYKPFGATIRAVIEFRSGGFGWVAANVAVDCNWHFYNESDREVIGNIYEHPDLLK